MDYRTCVKCGYRYDADRASHPNCLRMPRPEKQAPIQTICRNCSFDLEHTIQKNCPHCNEVLPLEHQERQGFELVKKAPKPEGYEVIVPCAKCGHTERGAIYIASQNLPLQRVIVEQYCSGGCPNHEHLHIICDECGFGFAEECTDHVMDASYEVTDAESGEGEGAK